MNQAGEMEQSYRNLIDSISPGILVLDHQGNVQYCNKVAQEIFGRTSNQIIGTNFGLAAERDRTFEIDILRHSGEIGTGELKEIEIAWFGEKAVLVIIEDITLRKIIEKEREEHLQSLKMESIGRLAGGVAHEFNNQLTVIIGNMDLILSETKESDSLYDALMDVRKAAERSANLTRQLLAYSRKQIVSPCAINLNNLIINTIKLVGRLIGENITIRTEFIEEDIKAVFDPGMFEQILMNLILNARDAMPEGGNITIEMLKMTLGENECANFHESKPGEYVAVRVSDTGMGMNHETVAHLFESFFTTKGIVKGTGLGLATVYGMIRQNNGYIGVKSAEGGGTSFTVLLTQAEGADFSAKDAGTTEKNKPFKSCARIILIEDETQVLKITEAYLRKLGFRVESFDSGKKALDAFIKDQNRFDVLITDVLMPGINGKEVADEMKKRCPGLKVLFTSGYTGNVLAEKGLSINKSNFLLKPFTPEALSKKLSVLLKNGD